MLPYKNRISSLRLPLVRTATAAAMLLPAAVAMALLPGAALADDQDVTVTNLVTKKLNVQSNGVSYTQVPILSNLIADVRVTADAGASGKVKSWKVWLAVKTEAGQFLYFPNFTYTKVYPWNQRPKSVDRTVQLAVPKSAWETFAVFRCNKIAEDLRAGGLSDAAIFGQDRGFELAVVPQLKTEMSGIGGSFFGPLEQTILWEHHEKVDVVCKKWSGAAIPQASNSITTALATVVNKGLSIYEKSTLGGTCKVRLDGWITTDHKGANVSFRYTNQEGKTSELHTVNTGDSKTATFSHWYDVQNNPEGPEIGQVRMVGVSHDFESGWSDYELNCVKAIPNTFAVNDPPKLTMTFAPHGKVMVHGRVCPVSVKLIGVLAGHGNFSGQALFYGPGYLSPLRDYSITHGEKVLIGAEAVLDWDDVPAPPIANAPIAQQREFGLNVTNENNVVIASLPKRSIFFECRRPTVNPAVQSHNGLTVEPRHPVPSSHDAVMAPRQLRVLPQATTPQRPQRLRRLRRN